MLEKYNIQKHVHGNLKSVLPKIVAVYEKIENIIQVSVPKIVAVYENMMKVSVPRIVAVGPSPVEH